jgi:Concanavalin A-like lectin/glucanases superfamily
VGRTLTVSNGTWSGGGSISYAYRWRRCGATYPSVVTTDSPVAYVRLDDLSGTTATSSTALPNGTYLGSPALNQPGAFDGDGDGAIALDRVNDAVAMPNPSLTGAFSLEFWAELAGDGTAGATGYGTLAGIDANHRILWQTNGGGAGGRLLASFNGDQFFSTSTATLNAWHQIVFTFDGTSERFYIDGEPAGWRATTQPSWNGTYYLGAYDLANYKFRGQIDEAAAYSRALTTAQVEHHYEAGLKTGCRDIAGATGATHLLVPADESETLQASVTATNSAGSGNASSSFTSAVVPAAPPSNAVTTENALVGTTNWLSPDATGSAIEGYTSQVSAAPGQQVDFHVSTNPAANYRIEIYRLGWYGGDGARLIRCLPSCSTDEPGTARSAPAPDVYGNVDAGWPVTDSTTVQSSWVSSYYVARLRVTSGSQAGSASSVYFIVRADPARHAAVLVEAAVNTWQAYNGWGGKSLYGGSGGPAVKVSFNRPGYGQSPLTWEYPAVRFLEREGYDVSYATNYDLAADPASLLNHRLVVSVGHDEYWTREMRANLQSALDSGVNLAFLGGNDMYWQARYEDSGRTLVEYRDPSLDPVADPALKTTLFRELVPSLPECQLVGVQDLGGIVGSNDPPRNYSVVSGSLGDPWFANTEFAPGATVTDIVGYEWDGIQPGCSVPALTALFHYTGATANGDSVRYTAASGASVFAAGTVQFAWALDGWGGHDQPPDPRVQQLVRNALAAMTK